MKTFPVLLACFLIHLGVSGQSSPDLTHAYKHQSQELLDAFIRDNDLYDHPSHDAKTQRMVKSVATALLGEYSRKEVELPYLDAAPYGEEYMVIQPEVDVCFTDNPAIDSASIRRRQHPTPLGEVVAYPHPDIFSFFMSENYTEFDQLRGCASYPLQTDKKIGDYRVVVADTSFVKQVQDFLHADTDHQQLHLRKVDFLKQKLKLFAEGGQVKPTPTQYTFQYALLIDRIIFDDALKTAYIQYSFRNKSSEAKFRFEDNQWVLQENMVVMMY